MVDTPPARSALDFLDAPEHLSSLLDGRFLRLLLAPTRGPFRLMSAGFGLVSSALNKVLGSQILTDVQTFVSAFEALFGGFRQRAMETFALLSSAHTTFFVVAHRRARRAARGGLLRRPARPRRRCRCRAWSSTACTQSRVTISAERALALAEDLARNGDRARPNRAEAATTGAAEATAAVEADIAIEALRRHAALMRTIAREQLLLERFSATRPRVPRTLVPAMPSDVTDLESLRRVGSLLADQHVAPRDDV